VLIAGEDEWEKDWRDLLVGLAPYHDCARRLGFPDVVAHPEHGYPWVATRDPDPELLARGGDPGIIARFEIPKSSSTWTRRSSSASSPGPVSPPPRRP
jgi:hypothetical protein